MKTYLNKAKICVILNFFILVCLLLIFTFLLWINKRDTAAQFYYPYSDNEYLNVNNTNKCLADENLEKKSADLIVESYVNYVNEVSTSQYTPDFISYDNYQLLKAAASLDDKSDVSSYHCSYIDSRCSQEDVLYGLKRHLIQIIIQNMVKIHITTNYI